MTRKQLYFISHNLKYVKILCSDIDFEPVAQYNPEEFKKISQYEYGRIKTRSNDFHLLLGNPPQKGCPWCGYEPTLKKLPSVPSCLMGPQEFSNYCLQCDNCGARGPVMNILSKKENDSLFMEEIKDIMNQKFKTRIAFNEGLNDR